MKLLFISYSNMNNSIIRIKVKLKYCIDKDNDLRDRKRISKMKKSY